MGAQAFAVDTNLWIFLCFGQSNMEGFPGIQEEDKTGVDARFQVFAAVDFPKLERKKGDWYPAVPPLCRPSSGLCPADYFGRTLVSNLPPAPSKLASSTSPSPAAKSNCSSRPVTSLTPRTPRRG
jgi:hypothetical protein